MASFYCAPGRDSRGQGAACEQPGAGPLQAPLSSVRALGEQWVQQNSGISTDTWPIGVIQICWASATVPAIPAPCREQSQLDPEGGSSTSLLCCGSSCSSASWDWVLLPAAPSKPLPRLWKPWLPILSHRWGWRRASVRPETRTGSPYDKLRKRT